MSHDAVVELLRRDVTPELYGKIRDLWKRHSIAEDKRDLPGLISTLTDDCVYEVIEANATWRGHAGATQFYTQLLTAFPDIKFELTGIVIGPQGVCEEASVTGTHKTDWLHLKATGERVTFGVTIWFPWDPAKQKFAGERVHVHVR